MKNELHENEQIKEASQRGAVEDLMHISLLDDGYDLRYSNAIGSKQKKITNQNV